MFWEVILGLVLLYSTYIILKYGINPYIRLRKFKGIKGVYTLPYIPIIGAFTLAAKSFKQHQDENHFAKIAYQTFPGCRAIVTNALNKLFIILTDPELLKEYFLNEKIYEKDRFFIENKIRVFGDGIAFAEGKQWAKQRKIMSSVFHYDFFEKFIPKIIMIVNEQLERLETEKKENSTVQISSLQFCSTVAGRTVIKSFFGIQFNQTIQNLEMPVFLIKLVAKVGVQERSLRNLFFGQKALNIGIFQLDRQVNNEIKIFRSVTRAAIDERLKAQQQEDGTLLKTLIDRQLIDTEQGLTKDKVIEQFLTLFVAGTDTTSHLMGMLFYYIAIYPQVQQKLRKQFSSLKFDELTHKSVNGLKYLDDTVKETFRHYDYMISTFPRVAKIDHKIGDLTIQAGDLIMPGWAQTNYHPDYFPNPHNFNPDRWKQAEKKPDIDMIFSPFSNGPRSCIGRNFALLQTKITAMVLLSKYNLKLKQGYVHILKTQALYQPVNPVMIELHPLKNIETTKS